MSWLSSLSIRFKILSIVVIAILGFSIILAFNFSVTSANKTSLQQIRDIYFPTLERIDASQVRLDKIKETLNAAASSAELDMLEESDAFAQAMEQGFAEVMRLDDETQGGVKRLQDQFQQYYQQARKLTVGIIDGNMAAADIGNSVKAMRASLKDFSSSLKAFRGASYQRFTDSIDAVNDNSKKALEVGFMVSLLAIFIVLVVGYFISTMISRNILHVVNSLEEMGRGEGDLTKRLEASGNDEIGRLALAFNTFVAKLQTIIKQIADSTFKVSSAAEEMSSISEESKRNSDRQLHETEQVAAAINQMSATVQEVSQNASSAASSAHEASDQANSGRNVVEQTISSINELASGVEKASEVIHKLESDTENIGVVLDVIRGISEQTNLLALNAAIEAARAGEQGRGFAVVADEVRTLASRTQESTEEIHSMIESLQSGSKNAVEAMDLGRQQAHASVQQAGEAGESLNAITGSVSSISDMNTQIATAAEEQSAVSEEINRNITNITQLGEQATEGASQTSRASDELARLAAELQTTVSQFRT